MCLSKKWNADVVQISSEISQIDIATSVSVEVDVGILANDFSYPVVDGLTGENSKLFVNSLNRINTAAFSLAPCML